MVDLHALRDQPLGVLVGHMVSHAKLAAYPQVSIALLDVASPWVARIGVTGSVYMRLEPSQVVADNPRALHGTRIPGLLPALIVHAAVAVTSGRLWATRHNAGLVVAELTIPVLALVAGDAQAPRPNLSLAAFLAARTITHVDSFTVGR
jgi:hypothetical protein